MNHPTTARARRVHGHGRARPTATAQPGWHAIASHEVLAALDTGLEGLSADEARARLARHGPNALPAPKPRHPLLRFLAQFHSTLIYALLLAALAAAAVGHHLDAAVIVAVVVVNALIGYLQEGRAENALKAIRSLVSPRAHVLRGGQRVIVPVVDLIPGDLVLLEAGDRVPADLRLLRARGLLIDEALLTGESVAAAKHEGVAAPEAALGDRHSMAYSGTLVLAGQGSGVVTATGAGTELGQVGAMLAHVESPSTPLLVQVDRFGRRFAGVVGGAAALLFAQAVWLRGWAWVDAMMAVVAMAVGVIPEGLPAVITITLAVGVQRMAARNAVIRRLPAVETLGATSVICTDKTGTLTRNEMTARRLINRSGHTLRAEGEGYAPEGLLQAMDGMDDAAVLADALPLLRCAVLCNDARLHEAGGRWSVAGDPMEGALLALAAKAGLAPEHERAEWARLDEIPFDAASRYMATLHRGPGGERVAFVKGAPEVVMAMDESLSAGERAQWRGRIAACAADGERLLGFGVLPAPGATLDPAQLRTGLRWLGLVGFIDPPRPEAREAIAACHAAGIAVKMITGDHVATAWAIARQLGLAEAPRAVTGAELDACGDADLEGLVARTDVFARTSPQHKLRIVQALQARGRVVAMTGDGVNDAPSLKQADVGVAMGLKGTEAAKEASEMVLLDDNFASIVNAVHEGRTVYDNVRKVIAWTLPTNGGEVLGVIAAMVLGLTLPMSAAQILWINLVTAVTLGLALAFEPPEPDVMRRTPRSAEAPLLSRFMLWRVALVSVLIAGIAYALLLGVLARGGSLPLARTLVVNAMTAMEVGYLFSVRFLHARSLGWRAALGTPAVLWAVGMLVLLQAGFTWLPIMNRWFETVPLGPAGVALALAAGLLLLLVLEAEKALIRRFGWSDEFAS